MTTSVNLARLEDFCPVDGYRAKLIHGDSMTVAHWTIDSGAELPEHAHPHEQIVNMLEGEFEMTMGGQSQTLKSGDVLVIPGGQPHGGRAITDCKIIDVWHPVREDYR